MADGEARPEDSLEEDTRAGIWRAIRHHRQTPFVCWAILAGTGLIAVVFWHTFINPQLLASFDAKLFFLAASTWFWLPLILLLRDSPDNLGHGPSARLPAVALFVLGLIAAAVAIVELEKFHPAIVHLKSSGAWVTVAFSGLALVFIPMTWNAVNLSRYEAAQRAKEQTQNGAVEISGDREQQDAEAMGALIATLLVVLIIGLASAAGTWGAGIELEAFYGVGLSAFVVAVFGIVIFLEPLSNLRLMRLLSRGLRSIARAARPLAMLYNSVDALFVRIGAVVAGMEHRGMWARYAVLFITLSCLCTLGWFLSPPLGLLPCMLGIILAVSVSRLWSWVEDDRALAALTEFKPTTPYRTSMREDYRDETLLGFVFVFALMPIMMRQVHESGVFGSNMFLVPEQRDNFVDWIGFFGIELAKAVPIVDWAEIYKIGANDGSSMIAMSNTASRHAVFLARATVDLVLIAALLQAIGISNRNRQQKRLFKAGADPASAHRYGLINRLDVFVERSELAKAISGTRKRGASAPHLNISPAEAHEGQFDLRRLSGAHFVDFRRYNVDRLSDVYAKSDDVLVRAFIAAISHENSKLSLKKRHELLEEMAEQGRSEFELYTVLRRLTSDVKSRSGDDAIPIEALRSIMFELRGRAGLKDFKLKLLDLMLEIETSDEEVIEVLVDVAGRSDADHFQYTRAHAVYLITEISCGSRSASITRKSVEHLKALRKRRGIGVTTIRAIDDALSRLRSCLEVN